MDSADVLSNECEIMVELLDILSVIKNRIALNRFEQYNDLECLIHFFRVMWHLVHIKNAETLIYPAIKEKNNTPTNCMLNTFCEKNTLADLYLSDMTRLLETARKGDRHAQRELVATMNKYIQLERKQVHDEQFFLIPVCKQELGDGEQACLGTALQNAATRIVDSVNQKHFYQELNRKLVVLHQRYTPLS